MSKPAEGLPEALAGLAREEQRALDALEKELDAELEQLTHGQLGAEQLTALERKAVADERLAAALVLYAPLPAEAQERFVAAARAGLRASPAPSVQVPVDADVVARTRRRRWSLGAASLGLAGAAAIALFGVRPTQMDAPPAYDIALTGGESEVRGETSVPGGAPVRLRLDGEIDLVLRPQKEIAGPLTVTTTARLADGSIRPLALPLQVSPVGAVRVSGRIRELFPGLRGPVMLTVLVRQPGAEVPESDGAAVGPGWRRVQVPIQLEPVDTNRR